MENSNRIQINGVWYVREAEATQPDEVKTVNWMIKRLQDLAEQGYGDCEMTFEVDYGGDYTTIGDIEPVRDWDNTARRVHIS
jgi:hypothetical protein